MSKDRPNRGYVTELANRAVAQAAPLDWFEPFYREAHGNAGYIPWADLEPNPNLVQWVQRNGLERDCGNDILVVGCGLGDDAAYLARSGSSVTAFDISSTAVRWARERFPSSHDLQFLQADLLDLPPEFERAFNLVVEIYTLQVLPEALRPAALEALAKCVQGHWGLLVICRGRDDDEPFGELPWGVSKRELAHLETLGLAPVTFEDYVDASTGSRRFRALFRTVE